MRPLITLLACGTFAAFLSAGGASAQTPEPFVSYYQGQTGSACAAAGLVGECVSTSVSSASPVSLTSTSVVNVASVSLTAGSWLIWGSIGFVPAGSTTQSIQAGSLNSVSNAMADASTGASVVLKASVSAGIGSQFPVGLLLVNLSSPATYYLNAQAVFSVSTDGAFGFIKAVRIR